MLAFYALRHLWLGYGYQEFWTGAGDSLRAMHSVGGLMHGADSGYLDIILQFGLLGLGLLMIILALSVRDILRLSRRPSLPLTAYWYAAIIVVIFIGSFTEGLFPESGGVSTFVFVVACAGLRDLGNAAVRPDGHSWPEPLPNIE